MHRSGQVALQRDSGMMVVCIPPHMQCYRLSRWNNACCCTVLPYCLLKAKHAVGDCIDRCNSHLQLKLCPLAGLSMGLLCQGEGCASPSCHTLSRDHVCIPSRRHLRPSLFPCCFPSIDYLAAIIQATCCTSCTAEAPGLVLSLGHVRG